VAHRRLDEQQRHRVEQRALVVCEDQWTIPLRRRSDRALLAMGLAGAYLGTACTVFVLCRVARWYGRYKTAHPGGWRQYV
jgi:hypothetical protein